MNDIVKPLTPDGMCGWDARGQLWLWKRDGNGHSGRIIGDPRGHKCRICLQGWILTTESLEDQRWSDEYQEWNHLSCFIRFVTLTDRAAVYSALVAANIRFGTFTEIPSGYWKEPDPWAKRSWFVIICKDAKVGFMIGFRKHVWSISVTPVDGYVITAAQSLQMAFQGERVTKEISEKEVLVHADSVEKLREYLRWIANNMGLSDWYRKIVEKGESR